jgi:hypothetical protein
MPEEAQPDRHAIKYENHSHIDYALPVPYIVGRAQGSRRLPIVRDALASLRSLVTNSFKQET